VVSAVVPPAETASYVVEEVVPEGWTVSNINENGQFDATSHTVKWGLFFDAAIRKLSFDLLAPTNSSAEISLNGTASFDGADFALTGSTQSVASSKLHRPQHNPSGWIDLDLNGVVGRDYAIQESTDLVNWTTIKTFRNLNGLIHYAESQAQPLRQKFYRAVLVP
jgi:hypothetical protein